MRLLARSLAGTTVAFLAAGATALAQGENCTHDTLAVDGGPIAATFCVAGPPAAHITVTETFVRGPEHFSRPLTVDVVNGAAVTRAVDDVALTGLGSNKQLHLTIAYRAGEAVLEHALLLPGAVVLK
jgi:thiamine monophosphate kinase